MNELITGGALIAGGLVLEANTGWFAGAGPVSVVLLAVGAVVAAIGLLRYLAR